MSDDIDVVATAVSTTPRPHDVRLDVDAYPFRGTATARYGDMDANGHLNNLALGAMHDDIRALVTAEVFTGIHRPTGRSVRVVNSQTVLHFLAEASWPATLVVGAGIGRIGSTSFVLSSALFVDGGCVSVCDSVMVTVDAAGPTRIENPARERLRLLALTV